MKTSSFSRSFILTLLMPLCSLAATNTVTTLTDEDDGNLNPANGSGTSLREAINHSAAGDIILFSIVGTNDTITLTNTLTIDKSLTIDGALSTNAPATTFALSDPPLTTSGNIEVYGRARLDAGDLFKAIDIAPASPSTVELSNMSVVRGYAGGFTPPGNSGAGISINSYVTAQIKGFRFENCNAYNGYGGAVYTLGDTQVEDSEFDTNQAVAGGAVSIGEFGSLTLVTSSMVNNSASSGGAINNTFGDLSVQSSTLSYNQASSFGGAIYCNNGETYIEKSSILHNSASWGGGFYLQSGYSYIWDSTVANNTGAVANAAAHVSSGEVWCDNTTFHGNDSVARIIYAGNCDFYLYHITFMENEVASGPEIKHESGTAEIYNSVFDNPSPLEGTFSASYNYYGDGHGLSSLGDFGGPTMTHVPKPGSPLIDAGWASYVTMDQLGQTRNDPPTIGAVEYSMEYFQPLWSMQDGETTFGEAWPTSPNYPTEPGEFDIGVATNGDIIITLTLNPEAMNNVVYRLYRAGGLTTQLWTEVGSYDGVLDTLSANAGITMSEGIYTLNFDDETDTAQYYKTSFEYMPSGP